MLAQMQSVSIKEKDGAIYFGESREYNKRGVTVVVLKGEPYELGYARGALLKPEIQSWVRDGLYMIKRYAIWKKRLLAHADPVRTDESL
jgi:hypothetical protein